MDAGGGGGEGREKREGFRRNRPPRSHTYLSRRQLSRHPSKLGRSLRTNFSLESHGRVWEERGILWEDMSHRREIMG